MLPYEVPEKTRIGEAGAEEKIELGLQHLSTHVSGGAPVVGRFRVLLGLTNVILAPSRVRIGIDQFSAFGTGQVTVIGVGRDVIRFRSPVQQLLPVHQLLGLLKIGLADQAIVNHLDPNDLVGSPPNLWAVPLATVNLES
jgi:hypothetical protein